MNNYALTFDVDWAPDFVIETVSDILISRSVKCTWFVTNHSPAVEKLFFQKDLFELGLHPNFLPGSTHGATEKDVMQHMKRRILNTWIVF